MSALLYDPVLSLAAETLDDIERTRIAAENRVRQMVRTEPDADGIQRGLGLDASLPVVAAQADLAGALAKLEHQAALDLQRIIRRHPLGAWVKATKGVGERQSARLLAAVGDPYWNTLHDRPRTVSELWAYCGLHVSDDGTAVRRQRGQRSNWSTTAKMRAWNVATSCVKGDGPYRAVYDDRRKVTADRLHGVPCVRCGPSGKPAADGTPWSAGHQHADALRIMSKAILKDLWLAARDWHEEHANG